MSQALYNKDINVLNYEFNDLDYFKQAISNWALDFRQLDSGRFESKLMILETHQIQIGTTTFNRKFDQNGISPAGFRTFALTSTREQSYWWRGYKVKGNDLLIHPKSGEFQSISDPGWGIFTIAISEKSIEQYKEDYEIGIRNPLDNGAEVASMPLTDMESFRVRLNSLIHQVRNSPGIIHNPNFQNHLSDEIPALLLNSLLWNRTSRKRPESRVRDIALSKALNYLSEYPTEIPSVSDLCVIAGASRRTMEYAFKEKYGIGPKEYMKKVRLNLVRRELKYADPKKAIVQEVANRYGFWHLGHFGSDYKRFFGELPSDTLRT